MNLNIAMEERYPVSIERVWEALTDPEMLERWLMRPTGYEAKVGIQFSLGESVGGGCHGGVKCKVLELSPPHRMVWSWRGAEDPTTTRLVIELEDQDQGTRLSLRHTGETDEQTASRTDGGWTIKLEALAKLLAL